MSADEFDPTIERLFAQAPHFPDSAFFEADVAARLNKASRVRSVALSAAGVVGGLIAMVIPGLHPAGSTLSIGSIVLAIIGALVVLFIYGALTKGSRGGAVER